MRSISSAAGPDGNSAHLECAYLPMQFHAAPQWQHNHPSSPSARPPTRSSPLISGGQPVVLVRYGRPIVVVLDVDSYVDAEPAVAGEHLTECRWAAVSSAQKRSTS